MADDMKAQMQIPGTKFPRIKPVRYWPLYGLRYRLLMRVMHRFGWCYMGEPMMPMPLDQGQRPIYWCQWCGMRGSK